MRLTLTYLALAALLGAAACGEDATGKDSSTTYPDWGGGNTYLDGPSSKQCSPASCSGCCRTSAMGTTCESGFTNNACGYGGAPCSVCTVQQKCNQGICSQAQTCDSTTCASGCCDSSGKCQSGTSGTSCGTGGAACQACASGEECSSAQKCQKKGPLMYKVTLDSAQVTGSSWIVCGFAELSECDLYVILTVGNKKATSSVKADTNKPTWNEYLLTETEAALIKNFEVEVRDDDPIGSVQIGKCKPSISSATLKSGKLITDCGDAKSLTFSFTAT